MEKIDKDYLKLYLKNVSTTSGSKKNTIICNPNRKILYVSNVLSKSKYKIGFKLNLNDSPDDLIIEKEEIKSLFTGKLLGLQYTFKTKLEAKFTIQSLEYTNQKKSEELPVSDFPDFNQWKNNLSCLNYADADLNNLITYIFSYNAVYKNSTSTKIDILDKNDKVIYENFKFKDKIDDSSKLTITTEQLISLTNGKSLGKVNKTNFI